MIVYICFRSSSSCKESLIWFGLEVVKQLNGRINFTYVCLFSSCHILGSSLPNCNLLLNVALSREKVEIYETSDGKFVRSVSEDSSVIRFSSSTVDGNVIIRYSKYPIERFTENRQIPYYVKTTFRSDFDGNLNRLEVQIEEEYANNLRIHCYREREYSELKNRCCLLLFVFSSLHTTHNAELNYLLFSRFQLQVLIYSFP